jgi:hypothetical protein
VTNDGMSRPGGLHGPPLFLHCDFPETLLRGLFDPRLTPAQRRAYVLADNKLALNAGWEGLEVSTYRRK